MMNAFIQSSPMGICKFLPWRNASRMVARSARWFLLVMVLGAFVVAGIALAEEIGDAGFEGRVVLEPVGDDPFVPSFRLQETLLFRQGNGTEWISPPGVILDGRSVPSLFVKVVGHPFEGAYRKSAVSYDYAVKVKERTWEAAQRMFFEALRTEGVAEPEARVMYLLLSGSGTRWAMHGPNSCFSRCHTDSKELEWRPRVDDDRLLALVEWAKTDNPDLDQIDLRARATILEPGPHIFGVME